MNEPLQTDIATLASSGALAFGDGYRTKRSELSSSGYRILRVGDISDGSIQLDGADFVDEAFAPQIGPKLSQAGDIILTTKGTVGRVAVVPALLEQAVYSPQVCYFRCQPDNTLIDGAYLKYWFLSAEFTTQSANYMNNTDMAAYLNLADIRSLKLALPPIKTQQAIAEVLGALDDKIAANTNLAEIADSLAATIFDTVVKSMETQPMSVLLDPILGGTPSRSNETYWDGDHNWISAKDITAAPFGVVSDTIEHISNAAVEATKAKPLPAGSVILTARGTVGKVGRLHKPSSFNQSCYGFVPRELPECVLYFSVLRARDQAKAISYGSVFDTITKRSFDHLQIPKMSTAVMRNLESRLKPLLDGVAQALAENRTLAAIRDALLPRLMSGELRVRDAEKQVEEVV